jgi:hypothetical protein
MVGGLYFAASTGLPYLKIPKQFFQSSGIQVRAKALFMGDIAVPGLKAGVIDASSCPARS